MNYNIEKKVYRFIYIEKSPLANDNNCINTDQLRKASILL
jgi:hypothetical protein